MNAVPNGYLYVATGGAYLIEALASVSSLKECDPAAHATLMSDASTLSHMPRQSAFDNTVVLRNPAYDFEDKINAMLESPYENTVFVDTDTRFVSPLDLWGVLGVFDLAFTYDPIRHDFLQTDIPDAFPTPNTGLIAFRRSAAVSEVLTRWKGIYAEQLALPGKPLHDQPAFRRAVYFSDVRFIVLPDEFNLRVIFPHMVGGNTRIKMLHGRHEKLTSALEYAGTTHFYPRVFGRRYSGREILRMLRGKILERCGMKPPAKRGGVTGKA